MKFSNNAIASLGLNNRHINPIIRAVAPAATGNLFGTFVLYVSPSDGGGGGSNLASANRDVANAAADVAAAALAIVEGHANGGASSSNPNVSGALPSGDISDLHMEQIVQLQKYVLYVFIVCKCLDIHASHTSFAFVFL